jgi:hypothetical protein
MSTSRSVEQKIGDWKRAYDAIREELTPEAFRALTSLAGSNNDVQSINVGVQVARVVFANDRAAATVAALITQTGIKPVGIDYGDEPE